MKKTIIYITILLSSLVSAGDKSNQEWFMYGIAPEHQLSIDRIFDDEMNLIEDRVIWQRKLNKHDSSTISQLLRNKKYFTGGMCDCRLVLFSLVMLENGKVKYQFYINLSGGGVRCIPQRKHFEAYEMLTETGLRKLMGVYFHSMNMQRRSERSKKRELEQKK